MSTSPKLYYETKNLLFLETKGGGEQNVGVDVIGKPDTLFGRIGWKATAHQYLFEPAPSILYSSRVLCDIQDYMARLMFRDREDKRKAKRALQEK